MGGFIRVLRFLPPVKLTSTSKTDFRYITEILLKMAINTLTLQNLVRCMTEMSLSRGGNHVVLSGFYSLFFILSEQKYPLTGCELHRWLQNSKISMFQVLNHFVLSFYLSLLA